MASIYDLARCLSRPVAASRMTEDMYSPIMIVVRLVLARGTCDTNDKSITRR